MTEENTATPKYEGTTFFKIYCRFLDKITDDMFLEMTLDDTLKIIDSLFFDSLYEFTYPRFRISNYDKDSITLDAVDEEGQPIVRGRFEDILTNEEEDIIAEIMLLNWFRRQLATTRITQMRYSTSDFKQTSQAAHMQRLDAIINSQRKLLKHKFNNYSKRNINDDNYIVSGYNEGLSGSGEKHHSPKYILTQLGVVRGYV